MLATEEITRVAMPRIGDGAPDFEALTSKGPLRLSDFKGSWLVFFSHPADFTPVCTTEFMAFTDRYPEFQQRNVQLLGLSVDSVQAHIAWLRNIEEKTGKKVPFPVVADLTRDVATKYGMLHPGQSTTETVRAVFLIDPEQKIRAIIYYPLTTGRSMDEILRLVDALQTTDKNKVSTPANWQPGEKVILPAPATQEAAQERVEERNGAEVIDWYFAKKTL